MKRNSAEPRLAFWGVALLLVLFLSVSGCSKSDTGSKSSDPNVSIVANGVLDSVDKSKTVGQAFDGYRYFKKVDWKAFTTDKGLNIVEVQGAIDFGKDEGWKKFADREGMSSVDIVYQFKVTDSKSFEIYKCSIRLVSNKSEKIENVIADPAGVSTYLKYIYMNKSLNG